MTVSSLNTGLSSALGYSLAKLSASAQATIDAATNGSQTTAASTSSPADGVSISNAAKIAAAEQQDNAKDFATLTQQVRQTLDTQYAADKADKTSNAPDLSLMSGRALAAIALNKAGNFSAREMAAAKKELNERARIELAAALKSGNAMGALVSYNQQLVSDYDGMTQEERDARGWTDKTRSTAESFITTVNGTDSVPSLFALLDADNQPAGQG
jgi:hypothetical protein